MGRHQSLTPQNTRTRGFSRVQEIRDILLDAVIAAALEVVKVKQSGEWTAASKDATELVTTADRLSDAAILCVFRSRLPAIDPEISFHPEESGHYGASAAKEVGADPLDGTNHFICGGTSYSIQAHFELSSSRPVLRRLTPETIAGEAGAARVAYPPATVYHRPQPKGR